jgi:hypothetical protein
MTKADIVQRLLDEQHITAEEAVILLSGVKLELKQTYPSWLTNSVYGAFSPTFPNPYTITATDINQINKEK